MSIVLHSETDISILIIGVIHQLCVRGTDAEPFTTDELVEEGVLCLAYFRL